VLGPITIESSRIVEYGIQRKLVAGSMLNLRASSSYGTFQSKKYLLPPTPKMGKLSVAVLVLDAWSWNDVGTGKALLEVYPSSIAIF
jgi:hypothetical protein